MKRSLLIIGSILSVITIGSYFVFYNYLPPRTPLKIARVRSGLNLNKDIQVIDFNEVYSYTGEGEIYILLKMDEKTAKNIVNDCFYENYKKLTIENLTDDELIDSPTLEHGYGFIIHGQDIASIKNGYYRLEANNLQKMDFNITILDADEKELIVYASFP